MAGDIDRRERIVVLPEPAATPEAARDGAGPDIGRAAARVREAGGGTVHEYGRVLVVDLAPGVDEAVQRAFSSSQAASNGAPQAAAALADDPNALSSDLLEGLEGPEKLGLAAFELRSSEGYRAAKAARAHAEEDWGAPGGDVLPPDPPAEVQAELDAATDLEDDASAAGAGASPTSARLTGRVAVGVVIVDGPTQALRFTAQERLKVVAEVQNGLGWLGAQSSPAGITWSYDIRPVSITARPASGDDTSAKKEARFRDPALAALGHGPGTAGARAYVEALRTARRTDWAFCVFFTKYPVGHFAYASIGGPRIVMHHDNDGWGPDNIDRVFAHETGHIFGAPDEYAGSNCSCGGQWGHFKVANANCDPCAGSGAVACLMKANSWTMCSSTPYHLGFPQGARYTGVYVSGSGAHGLWTNASWDPFVARWQQWSAQGLRLVDLDVARIGSQTRFSGAFRQGSGAYGLWALADYSSFVQRWQQWSAQGLRLVDLEVTPIGSTLRYSGVFQAGGGGYGLWVLADWSSFVQRWQQWSAQGLRLTDLNVTIVGGQPRYSGVFTQGTGTYGLWALADWSSFTQRWQQWSAQGMRLIDIERTVVGRQTRWSGVFRQGSGGYALWANASWQSFRERWQRWSQDGLRLIDVAMEPTGIESASAPELTASAGSAGSADSAFEGLLGLAGAPVVLAQDEGPVTEGEGMLDLGEELHLDGLGLGQGGVTLSGSGVTDASVVGIGDLAPATSPPPPAAENGAPTPPEGAGDAVFGDLADRAGPLSSAEVGRGDLVTDAPAAVDGPAVPSGAGIGAAHLEEG